MPRCTQTPPQRIALTGIEPNVLSIDLLIHGRYFYCNCNRDLGDQSFLSPLT